MIKYCTIDAMDHAMYNNTTVGLVWRNEGHFLTCGTWAFNYDHRRVAPLLVDGLIAVAVKAYYYNLGNVFSRSLKQLKFEEEIALDRVSFCKIWDDSISQTEGFKKILYKLQNN